jgi:hypothetical protein
MAGFDACPSPEVGRQAAIYLDGRLLIGLTTLRFSASAVLIRMHLRDVLLYQEALSHSGFASTNTEFGNPGTESTH